MQSNTDDNLARAFVPSDQNGINQPPANENHLAKVREYIKDIGKVKTSDDKECGDWIVNLEDGRLCFYSLGISSYQQNKLITEAVTLLGRDIHFNTGGHGSEHGLNPTNKGMGEAKFAMQDGQLT